MAFFDDTQRAKVTIKRMVFHLVGPEAKNFVLLQETSPGKFADFFLDRILSVNGGILYRFSDASSTRTRLARIAADGKTFQAESESLAEDFQQHHGGSAAAGAFLVFEIDVAGEQCFALLKYDDETVLSYGFEEDEKGRKKVSLEALERTFVQNREALQKSALIRLTDGGGELVVLDRRNQQKVARYFETFLGAKRVHENAEITSTLVKVTRDLFLENKELVPEQVFREMTKRTYDAAAAGGSLGVDDQKDFLDSVLGQKLPDDHPLVAKYHNALRRARIDGTPVTLDASAVKPPASRRYVTRNKIFIRVPTEMIDAIKVEGNQIIINDRLETTYDDPEPTG